MAYPINGQTQVTLLLVLRPCVSCAGQLWACCNEHKLAALALVLKDLPYLGKTEVLLEA